MRERAACEVVGGQAVGWVREEWPCELGQGRGSLDDSKCNGTMWKGVMVWLTF